MTTDNRSSFTIKLPQYETLFPKRDKTSTDHYRFNAGGWIIATGLDPYTKKDREVFRDAVLSTIPKEWYTLPHTKKLLNTVRGWKPGLASIIRSADKPNPVTQNESPYRVPQRLPPRTEPLPPIEQGEPTLIRDIVLFSMQIRGKGDHG